MSEFTPVVSVEWLSNHLDRPDVAVIDCRFQLGQPLWGSQQYDRGHIPGAFYCDLDRDLSSPVQRHGGRHPLPNIEEFSQKLASMGIISGETLVVAYDDARCAFAARLWWLLRYLGHDRVAVLDGGWEAWRESPSTISTEVPHRRRGAFTATPRPEAIVGIDRVRAISQEPSSILVDAREGDRYRGEREPIDPIAGHIPGAINAPWKAITDDRGYLLPQDEQRRLWADHLDASEIVVYCGSGVTACVNLFSLSLAGVPQAKLYPGGWSDWCSYLLEK